MNTIEKQRRCLMLQRIINTILDITMRQYFIVKGIQSESLDDQIKPQVRILRGFK